MTVIGCFSIAAFLKTHLFDNQSDEVAEKTDAPIVNSFAEQYPFDKEVDEEQSSTSKFNLLIEYRTWIEHIKKGFDSYTNNSNYLSSPIMYSIHWYDKLVQGDIIQGDIILYGKVAIVRLPNGYFAAPFPYSHPIESWNLLKEFDTWLKSRNIQYMSLITADKGDDSFLPFPKYISLGYCRMEEEYCNFMDENGIAYLRSKPKLLNQNSDFYYWFYKADHHWNVHAGRLMAEETAKQLNILHIDADTCGIQKECFTLINYPNSFLGSYARKLGPDYQEDFEIYFPLYETNFHLEIPSKGIDKTGSFDSTLIAKQYLSSTSSQYAAFLYEGNPLHPLIRVENLNSHNTTRALVIKHSKAGVFNPYFALTVRYLDIIDPRKFNGSIRSFIEKTRPDIVITCVDVIYEGMEDFWRMK